MVPVVHCSNDTIVNLLFVLVSTHDGSFRLCLGEWPSLDVVAKLLELLGRSWKSRPSEEEVDQELLCTSMTVL